jgi:hypothetical protein
VYEAHTESVARMDGVWRAIGGDEWAKPFMVTWEGGLSVCDMIMQIERNIWCVYESLDVRVQCGCDIIDDSGTGPSVREIATVGGFVPNMTAGLVVDKQDIALPTTEIICMVSKEDLFLFKEERDVLTNETVCIRAHGFTPNKLERRYDVFAKEAAKDSVED